MLTRFRDINVITIIEAKSPMLIEIMIYSTLFRFHRSSRSRNCRLLAKRKISFQVDSYVGECAWVFQPRGLFIRYYLERWTGMISLIYWYPMQNAPEM